MIKNIWDYHKLGGWVGIPTNVGWTVQGYNVMGAGLAFQAKEIFPDLPFIYGQIQRERHQSGSKILVTPIKEYKLLMLPTKPLGENPSLSWQKDSDLGLIKETLKQLDIWLSDNIEENVYIPYLGCGNGKLKIKDIKPLIEELTHKHRNLIIIDKNVKG